MWTACMWMACMWATTWWVLLSWGHVHTAAGRWPVLLQIMCLCPFCPCFQEDLVDDNSDVDDVLEDKLVRAAPKTNSKTMK